MWLKVRGKNSEDQDIRGGQTRDSPLKQNTKRRRKRLSKSSEYGVDRVQQRVTLTNDQLRKKRVREGP